MHVCEGCNLRDGLEVMQTYPIIISTTPSKLAILPLPMTGTVTIVGTVSINIQEWFLLAGIAKN